jgi:hypothetical protein
MKHGTQEGSFSFYTQFPELVASHDISLYHHSCWSFAAYAEFFWTYLPGNIRKRAQPTHLD